MPPTTAAGVVKDRRTWGILRRHYCFSGNLFSGNREDELLRDHSFDVNKRARVDSQGGRRRKAARDRIGERLSGELLGLTRGCDLRKEGVTVTTQANNPNNRIIDA
jgi:hypothetical protein